MAPPYLPGWASGGRIRPPRPLIMPPRPRIIPPWPLSISIMLAIALGAGSDCMSSRMTFRPSSPTPEPCIVAGQSAPAAFAGSVTFCASVAIVLPATTTNSARTTSIVLISHLMAAPPVRFVGPEETAPQGDIRGGKRIRLGDGRRAGSEGNERARRPHIERSRGDTIGRRGRRDQAIHGCKAGRRQPRRRPKRLGAGLR